MNIIGLESKKADYYCDTFPEYYTSAKGVHVWNGRNKYIDFSHMGVGACMLGYANKWVDLAVKKVINQGNFSSLTGKEEVRLSSRLIDTHRWAKYVRYARTGGESMKIALEIAKSCSKKQGVLQQGYSGWILKNEDYSKFNYNDVESFYKNITNKTGIVIVEGQRYENMTVEFAEFLRDIANSENYILIIDEITSGYRFHKGGVHLKYGIEPDIAVFGKGISNGYPMGAILMKESIAKKSKDLFISSTYWTDRIGPAAALQTIRALEILEAPKILAFVGKKIKDSLLFAAKQNNIMIELSESEELVKFEFSSKNNREMKTLFTELMLKEGYLANNIIYPAIPHMKKNNLVKYMRAVNRTFRKIAQGYSLKGSIRNDITK